MLATPDEIESLVRDGYLVRERLLQDPDLDEETRELPGVVGYM